MPTKIERTEPSQYATCKRCSAPLDDRAVRAIYDNGVAEILIGSFCSPECADLEVKEG